MELKTFSAVPIRIWKAVMMGMLAVLDADWSVITKYRGIFDFMNISELSSSVPATIGRPLSLPHGRWPTSHFWHKSLCCHKDFCICVVDITIIVRTNSVVVSFFVCGCV